MLTVMCWNVNGKKNWLTKKKKIIGYDPVIAAIIEPRSSCEIEGY